MRKYFVLICSLSYILSQNGLAQGLEVAAKALVGEFSLEVARSTAPHKTDRRMILTRTEKHVTVYVLFYDGVNKHAYTYTAPNETRIVSASFKADDGTKILILLSNGNVVILYYDPNSIPFRDPWHTATPIPISILANAQKIIGDAVYVLKNSSVFASWDTVKTWAIDSINISKLTTTDISIDTNYYGWISTSQGIFSQHPDSNIWRKAALLPAPFQNAYSIFVDRKNKIFVSRPGQVFVSTDRGSSWSDISSGITQTITSFGDDAFGNIYAVGWDMIFRLSNLTPPWISIGDSIKVQEYLPSGTKIVNSISGDSILYAATRYGMFQSTDYGTRWVFSPRSNQSRAHNFYTGVVKGGNYYFISTNLGIYRVASGDTLWEKVFPKQGFLNGVNVLTSDSAGNVYGNLPIKTGPSSWLFYTVKSTDYGSTWISDTAGFKSLGISTGTQTYDFWVDRQGTQYLGGNARFLTKKPGQAWKLDTAGLGMQANQYIKTVTLNNKKGIIYLSRTVFSGSLKLFIYSKASSDSAWKIVNTSILAAGDGILSSDQDGNIIVKAFSSPDKIWRYNGSIWTETPLPTTIGSTPSPYPLTVDRNGVIWAAFFAGGSNQGVYFTSDNGTTWKYVGLKGVGINFLNAVDDTTNTLMKSSGVTTSTTYAVTIIDGIYGFTTATIPTSAGNDQSQIVKSYELFQNYPNPFNPTTTIQYNLLLLSKVSLKVYNILGQEVANLINAEQSAGYHDAVWNAKDVSSGIYFYKLTTGNYVGVKKLMLLK